MDKYTSYLKKWKPKASLMIVIVAALALEATALVQYFYSKEAIKAEASQRAKGQLEATRNKILDVVDQVETAVKNTEWITQWALDYPDSLQSVCKRIVTDNPVIVGSTVATVPDYYKGKRKLFSPYCYKDLITQKLTFRSLATEEYNYPEQEWFVKPIELEGGYWSEPYVDVGGGEILMTTYSVPIRDKNGKISAVLTSDISLDWLTALIEGVQVYPNAFGMILSRSGQIMVAPQETLIMNKTIDEVASNMEDSLTFFDLNHKLLSGKAGSMQIDDQGVKRDVFFTPVERTGWSLSTFIPEKEVYRGLNKIRAIVTGLQLLGIIMIILIVRLAAKNIRRTQMLNERREKMESELKIGRDIQMSMIPKTFPPFPERKDLDLYASLTPAKEVSGDLYDFFINDDRLYFCIGDVSGKGVPASLVMAVTRSLFRSVTTHETSPKQIVSQMNNSLADMNESSMFVTFFCGVLNLSNGILRYCNAGHNAPMLLNGNMEMLDAEPNIALGVIRGMEYKEQETVLNYDDSIFLYTDGLTEAENTRHEQFGEERMKSLLHPRRCAKDHLEVMQKAVAEFAGDAPQSDDLTMLFIHYLNIKPHEQNWSISLHNDIGEIPLLSKFIKSIGEEKKIDESVTSNINLAVEEAVTNVMNYAYPEGTVGKVGIEVVKHPSSLEIILTDQGKPFDPTKYAEADTTLSAAERKIGGLGIHLYKNIMDSVIYIRENDTNILRLIKNI